LSQLEEMFRNEKALDSQLIQPEDELRLNLIVDELIDFTERPTAVEATTPSLGLFTNQELVEIENTFDYTLFDSMINDVMFIAPPTTSLVM